MLIKMICVLKSSLRYNQNYNSLRYKKTNMIILTNMIFSIPVYNFP